MQPLGQQFIEGKSEISLPRPHVGDVDRAVELHWLDKTFHNLCILVNLLELVLHVSGNLAFARGQTELAPPRICRIDQTNFLLVMLQALLSAFLDLLDLNRRLTLAGDQ